MQKSRILPPAGAMRRLRHLPRNLLQSRDLRHDRSRFLFERGAHGLIVYVWHLACFVLEIQIAQVLVDRFLALAEIAEPGFFFSGIDFAGKEENVIKSGGCHDGADEENHRSVSLSLTSLPDRGFSRTRVSALHGIVIGRSPCGPSGATRRVRCRAGW